MFTGNKIMKSRTPKTSAAILLICLALTSCSSPDEKEARHMRKGNALFEAGEYEKARIEYKNALKIKPTEAEIFYRLGLVEEAENNFRDAFNGFTRAEQQDPHFHPALLKVGEYYLAAEEYAETQKRLDTVLTDSPEEPEGRALNAAMLLRHKKFDEAEAEARFALSKEPSNIVAYSVLVGLYTAQNNDAKIASTLEEGIAHNPKDLSLLVLKAQIYQRTGNQAKVAEAYEAIFKLRPNESRYRLNLASVYVRMNKVDEAEDTLRSAEAAMPDDWDIKHQLVVMLDEKRGADVAEKEINALLKEYPKKSELYSWLVDLYIHHDRTTDAEALLNKIIADNGLNQTGLKANILLARIQYVKGNAAEAEKLLAPVLEKTPNDIDGIFLRAHIAADRGDYQSAIIDLRAVTRDRPKSKEALQLLSEVYMSQGHPDLAIETLNQFIDIDPTNVAARVRLAQLYHANGNTKKAESILFLVTTENPQYPVGWESTARIALADKDWETAGKAIDTLDKLPEQHFTATLLHGELMVAQNKPADSVTDYRAVIESAPNTALVDYALIGLVAAYDKLKQDETAVQFLSSMKSPTALSEALLGKCYLKLNKGEEAAQAFDRAIAAKSNQIDIYIARAQLYMAGKDAEHALATLKTAEAVAPNDPRVQMFEASILENQDRTKEAREVYEALLKRNPSLDVAANNLAELIADFEYEDSALLEKAKQTAERFIASSNPYYLDTLAWVYYRVGDFNQAAIMMERSLAAGAKMPAQSHYHFGAILSKTDKSERAKAELTEAVSGKVRYPGLDDAKAILAKIK